MEAAALHPVPHWTVPIRRQHALLLESGRVRLLFLASIAVPLLVRFFVEGSNAATLEAYVRRGATALPDGSGYVYEGFTYYLQPTLAVALPWLGLMPILWALMVWRGEGRDRRGHHWALPVGRSLHDAVRVAAGAVWLTAGVGLFALTGLGIALLDGPAALLRYGATGWINLFTLPLLIYLGVSVVAILAARPMNWLIGIGFGIGALGVFLNRIDWTPVHGLFELLFESPLGLSLALSAGFEIAWTAPSRALHMLPNGLAEVTWNARSVPGVGHWLFTVGLWLVIAAAAVILASRRRPG